MSADLADPEETRSFLIPAYALEEGPFPAPHELDRRTIIGPVNGPHDEFATLRRDDRWFYPRGSANFLFSASALLNDSIGESNRPFSIRLQVSPGEKPASLRSSCLTVQGRRVAERRFHDRTERVPAYAAWQTPNGDYGPWISNVSIVDEAGNGYRTKTVCSQWGGRGVLCDIAPGRLRRYLLLEFRIFDDDPEQSDLLKIWASRCEIPLGRGLLLDPAGEPLGDAWRQLIERAERGYHEECLEPPFVKDP